MSLSRKSDEALLNPVERSTLVAGCAVLNPVERSTLVAGCAVLTYLVLLGFGLLGMVPFWVWVVALPLHFIAGMLFEQEKCSEDGPIRR